MKMLKDNSIVKNLQEAADEAEEEYEDDEEDPEGSLTKEDLMEIISRKKTNRLH